MGFLDNISKTISQGIDRAKFEADKLARVTRVQSEIGDIRRQLDTKRLELADRAVDLHKAGQIQSASIAALAREIESMRSAVTLKEDELQAAQGDAFVEPPHTAGSPPAQNVAVTVEPPPVAPPQRATPPPSVASDRKSCPSCGFVMPTSAMFCPNCGARVGA